MKQKAAHSKMASVNYETLKIQPYFIDGSLNSGDVKLLFSLRTRMVNVRCNYKNSYDIHCCPLCESDEDTQEHLLVCPTINPRPPEVVYTDIFCDDQVKRNETLRALKDALERREKELNKEEVL
jgi:hypothetical protein